MLIPTHSTKPIIAVVVCILTFIGWLLYITLRENECIIIPYIDSQIFFPPKIDDELKFFSEEVCSKSSYKVDFEVWKMKFLQLESFDQSYQSDFLGKATQLIQYLKKIQEISTMSQGDAQSFTYYQKQLNDCSLKIKLEKDEIQEQRKKSQLLLMEKEREVDQRRQRYTEDVEQLSNVTLQNTFYSEKYRLIIKELQEQINQKERLRRSYKNETELAIHNISLNDQIEKSRNFIEEQRRVINRLQTLVDFKDQQFQAMSSQCSVMQNQLSDAKSLEQYFHSDDFYVKEDIPIIQVFEKYNLGLQNRLKNLVYLTKKEKDPQQREKNEKAKSEIEKMVLASESIYQTVKSFQQDCKDGLCFFETSFNQLTLNGLRGEIARKQEKYFSMIQEKSTIEIELTKLQESLKEERARFEQERQKLSKLIDEQNALNKDKDRQKELQNIQERINQLERQKQELQVLIDKTDKKLSDLKNEVDTEGEQIQNLKKQTDKLQMEQYIQLSERESQLKKSLKDCIKQKKLYEYYKANQVNLIKQVNQIKQQIPDVVKSLENVLVKYKENYKFLNLKLAPKRSLYNTDEEQVIQPKNYTQDDWQIKKPQVQEKQQPQYVEQVFDTPQKTSNNADINQAEKPFEFTTDQVNIKDQYDTIIPEVIGMEDDFNNYFTDKETFPNENYNNQEFQNQYDTLQEQIFENELPQKKNQEEIKIDVNQANEGSNPDVLPGDQNVSDQFTNYENIQTNLPNWENGNQNIDEKLKVQIDQNDDIQKQSVSDEIIAQNYDQQINFDIPTEPNTINKDIYNNYQQQQIDDQYANEFVNPDNSEDQNQRIYYKPQDDNHEDLYQGYQSLDENSIDQNNPNFYEVEEMQRKDL